MSRIKKNIQRNSTDGELLWTVRRMLFADKRSMSEVSELCGIPQSYLFSVMYGKYKDPAVNRIEAIFIALTGHGILE